MTLIYPRAKPYGANSSNSGNAIRDDAKFPTEVIDYLKFEIFDPIDDKLTKTLYLYLPNKLSESYTAKYNGVELGATGAAAVGAARDAIASGGIGDSFGEQVKAFAKAAKPQLGYSLGANAINAVVSATGGSGNLNANSLSALTKKRIFNPYEEAIFQGTTFRDHNFDFKMAPKDKSDVDTIIEIVDTFRKAMLPGKDGDQWLTLPNYFRMAVMRHTSSGDDETISEPGTSGYLSKIMQFPTNLVLTDMNVDLSPDGNYASLQTRLGGDQSYDYGPVSYSMRLAFKETSYLTRESFK
jgi:hypothetical protein